MKANELRMGNYVKFITSDNEYSIIGGLDSDNVYINERTWNYVEFEEIEPIPLTEDWWDKFKEDEFILTDKSGFVIFKNRYAYQFIFIDYPYVHQLQNLYFALTQKELK